MTDKKKGLEALKDYKTTPIADDASGLTTNRGFNPSGSNNVDLIKAKVLELEEIIQAETLPGRRRALALTNLETAAMYAVKAVFEA